MGRTMNRRLRTAMLATTLSAVGSANAAWAQTATPAPVPPVRSPLDENGVNVATGLPQFATP
jgi:hypothetical protein